jgi:membrane-bound lytic murein transglycosylase D
VYFMKKTAFLLGTMVAVGSSFGCATVKRDSDFPQNSQPQYQSSDPFPSSEAYADVGPEFSGLSDEAAATLDRALRDLQKKADQERAVAARQAGSSRGSQEMGLQGGQLPGAIPIVMNDDVRRWIEYFSERDRDRFRRFLERGLVYKDLMQHMLRENGLPQDLYYIAMIESGFVNQARSRAAAVGTWQFMRATGQRYNLQANYHVDERQDPIRATEAATKYFRDLYNVFNDWYLAMSAYNAGESRVMGAIMRGKTRDFWELSEKNMLPRETRNYVPKFLAALIIGENPEKFGFHNLTAEKYPSVEFVEVPSPVRLSDIARVSGVSYDQLKQVNPHLRQGVTPGNASTYELWVPVAGASAVRAQVAQLGTMRVQDRQVASAVTGTEFHQVSAGESLSLIASRYGVSVGYIMRMNGLRSSRIYAGQRLRVSQAPAAGNASYHVVRSGENLSAIARRYGVSVNYIKSLNGLNSDRILAGSRLRVAATGYDQQSGGGEQATVYRVRAGDNLYSIARRHSMSVNELKRINGLRQDTIHAGQSLRVSKGI